MLIALAVIAALESVVHLGRIRAAVSDRAVLSGLMVFCVCGLRFAFVVAGASAVLDAADPLVGVAVYGGTAAVVTAVLQAWVVRTDRRAEGPASRSPNRARPLPDVEPLASVPRTAPATGVVMVEQHGAFLRFEDDPVCGVALVEDSAGEGVDP